MLIWLTYKLYANHMSYLKLYNIITEHTNKLIVKSSSNFCLFQRTDQPWIQKNIPYKICHTFVVNPKNKNDGAT